jgi:ribonuclease D
VAIDLEWRPDRFKDNNNPVALIQLATTSRCVLLRTVNWDTSGGGGLPEALGSFFSEAPNRFFVGFSWASGDEKKMQSSFGVGKEIFSNFCDLQELAQVLGYGKKCGLAWLTKEVLGAELPKDVARSDWEATALTDAQKRYSALDAFSLHAILAGWRMALTS